MRGRSQTSYKISAGPLTVREVFGDTTKKKMNAESPGLAAAWNRTQGFVLNTDLQKADSYHSLGRRYEQTVHVQTEHIRSCALSYGGRWDKHGKVAVISSRYHQVRL